MASKPAPSKRSTNPRTAGKMPKRPVFDDQGTAPRAHRDNTGEARQQRERMPKTHPNSAGRQPAARKARKGDKE